MQNVKINDIEIIMETEDDDIISYYYMNKLAEKEIYIKTRLFMDDLYIICEDCFSFGVEDDLIKSNVDEVVYAYTEKQIEEIFKGKVEEIRNSLL